MLKEDVLGIKVSTGALDEIVDKILRFAESNSSTLTIACANPHSLMVAQEDREFFEALNDFHILLPDGIGVVSASRILGGKIRKKIGGPDLFRELSRYANDKGGFRYFFLGSTEDVIKKIRKNMQTNLPNVELVGTYSPPFGEFWEKKNQRIIETINESKPTVLWVGMTAPKQEKWIYRNRSRLKVPIIGAVGAAFDYFAGTKKRPQWMIDRGLGWLFRLISEPRRLWKRYLISAPIFAYLVLKQRIS
ncbi:MAG: WecB/TagA/CpsF family glycosyltransferase [Desulfobacterales bacterium]|nr:WecB/TagA/CpsF family glycosyltransferase [Desulfobacterales bacterium]